MLRHMIDTVEVTLRATLTRGDLVHNISFVKLISRASIGAGKQIKCVKVLFGQGLEFFSPAPMLFRAKVTFLQSDN